MAMEIVVWRLLEWIGVYEKNERRLDRRGIKPP